MAELSTLNTPSNMPQEFLYQGIIYPCSATKSKIEFMKKFAFYPDDVLIAGYPRSGNNWTQAIICAILQANDLRNFETEGMKHILNMPLEFASFEKAFNIPRPSVFYTHVLPSTLPEDVGKKKAKVIHVMRNPNDVAVANYHFHRMNKTLGSYEGSWEEFFPFFHSGNIIYGSWYKYTEEWLTSSGHLNIKFIHYEDMVADPRKAVADLSKFLGKSLSGDQVEEIVRKTSLKKMQANPVFSRENNPALNTEISGFLRKGIVGDWKTYFTDAQIRAHEERFKELVKKTGIHFRFE